MHNNRFLKRPTGLLIAGVSILLLSVLGAALAFSVRPAQWGVGITSSPGDAEGSGRDHDHAHADHAHDDPAHDDHAHDDHAHDDHAHDDHAHDEGGQHGEAHGEHAVAGAAGHQHQDHQARRSEGLPSQHGGVQLELSRQARSNLQLVTRPVRKKSFIEYTEVPAIITAWPGRTHIAVTSPLTGVINSIRVSRGELVKGGEPMFTLRLTHQDLVNTQQQFLSQLGQLDVAEKEIRRLESVSSSGAVAGKTRIAREYERDKLLAGIRAARQALLLHGLTEQQIQKIENDRKLVRELVVRAPELHQDRSLHHDSLHDTARGSVNPPAMRLASLAQPPTLDHPPHLDVEFLVSNIPVRRGQSVSAGETLAELSDYSELLIEGHAFQKDGEILRRAAESSAAVQAIFNASTSDPTVIGDLTIVYIGNEVGEQSRTLPFYVSLSNEIERSVTRGEKRYVSWKYKPGQRLQLRLPVTSVDNVIVLPKRAVAEEGPERFVFIDHGDHVERIGVQIVAQDSRDVAIKPGPRLPDDEAIVVRGTHQLQMAFENRGGRPVDPHAGHSH